MGSALKSLNSMGANSKALDELAGQADKLGYFSGAGQMSLADLTAFARTILDDLSASAVLATLGVIIQPQCRLVFESSTSIVLQRYNGKYIIVNGNIESIPSAGVTLSNSGLSALTTYYIYVYMSSGTMTLEASTTSYTADSTTGIKIKSGSAAKTLVGMIRTNASSQFVDSGQYRFVLSYYNRRSINNACTADVSSGGTYATWWVEVDSNDRIYFLTWADEVVFIAGCGFQTSAGSDSPYIAIAVDGGSSPSSPINITYAATEHSSILLVIFVL